MYRRQTSNIKDPEVIKRQPALQEDNQKRIIDKTTVAEVPYQKENSRKNKIPINCLEKKVIFPVITPTQGAAEESLSDLKFYENPMRRGDLL